MRISNSFSEGEIQVMEFVLQTLLRGGSPTMATRHKDFGSLYRKVISMKKRVVSNESASADGGAANRQELSSSSASDQASTRSGATVTHLTSIESPAAQQDPAVDLQKKAV